MVNKVNNQQQVPNNLEAKPVGNIKNANKPQSMQTLSGAIGSRGNVNKQKQNTKPQTARSNGGRGLNSQSQNIQPQTARGNGGKGLNSQKQNTKGVTALSVNNNTNMQKNNFPSALEGGNEEHGFYDDF